MGNSYASSSISAPVPQDEKFYSIVAENEVGILDLEGSKDDYIRLLVQKENLSSSERVFDASSFDWLKTQRLNAIIWILKVSLSVFFTFLSVNRILPNGQSWIMRLLSVACLSLAVKLEGGVARLGEYLVEDCWIDKKAIQRMELLETELQELVPGVKELLLGVITGTETNLIDHRPSIIAAAAVLAANESLLTKETLELKINAISMWRNEEIDHIFSFYNMMKGKLDTPKSIPSAKEVPKPPSGFGGGTKRRLTFVNCKAQDYSPAKHHRQ
ncbi:hypothetical protein Ancab_003875 [Ancistrocladus abbreviatus]